MSTETAHRPRAVVMVIDGRETAILPAEIEDWIDGLTFAALKNETRLKAARDAGDEEAARLFARKAMVQRRVVRVLQGGETRDNPIGADIRRRAARAASRTFATLRIARPPRTPSGTGTAASLWNEEIA